MLDSMSAVSQGAVLAALRAYVNAWEGSGESTPASPEFVSVADVLESDASGRDWLWEGYVAVGSATLLVGEPKGGKSHLVYGLIAALERGEPFLNLKTTKSRTVILTEENDTDIAAKIRRYGIKGAEWLRRKHAAALSFPDAMRAAVLRAKEIGARLIVVDTLAYWGKFGEGGENDSSVVNARFSEGIAPACADGLAVVAIHHTSRAGRGKNDVNAAIRGSTSFAALFEVNVLLRGTGTDEESTRTLYAIGRPEENPDSLVYVRKGGEFRALGATAHRTLEELKADVLRAAREAPAEGYTEDELLKAAKHNTRRGKEALTALVNEETVTRSGRGVPRHPYRFAASSRRPRKVHRAA